MSSSLRLANLPALRKQQLLSEFTGLKQACPSGVFVALAPGDPTVWYAVLFIRDGPYAPAILRFQITFSDAFPRRAPIITFASDIFHPLITPLTTYKYTTDLQDTGTVNTTEKERLPPGGFSLRHGFPEWFGLVQRNSEASLSTPTSPAAEQVPMFASTEPGAAVGAVPPYTQTNRPAVSMYQVLKYIKSTFDKPEVLDSVPIDAAGNPGAWHAWRVYRERQQAKDTESVQQGSVGMTPPTSSSKKAAGEKRSAGQTLPRKAGEWNWEGVWEERVKKGVAASLSEPALYGGVTVNDELIRFLYTDETEAESIKDNLLRTLGTSV